AGMPAPQRQNRRLGLRRHRPPMRMRRPRPLGQPMLAIRLVARRPLIDRLPTNRVPFGELGHRPLIAQPVGDKRHTLIHRAGLRLGHPSSLAGCPGDLSPMYPVYSVTYLSGSDPPTTYHLPPATYHLPPTTHHPPPTTHHPPSTTHHRPARRDDTHPHSV